MSFHKTDSKVNRHKYKTIARGDKMKCEHEWIGKGKEKHCKKCRIYPDLLRDIFYIKRKR